MEHDVFRKNYCWEDGDRRIALQQVGLVSFRCWDVGGHKNVRRLWIDYFLKSDAIVFIIDSVDSKRLPESKSELISVLKALPNDIPVAILSNKADRKVSVHCPS